MARWLKPLVTLALYALVFYWTDATAIAAELGRVNLQPVVVGVLLYMAGQAISSWKWQILLQPVQLDVPYRKILGFYFTGMFFNLFLPTIVGGDAVKAVLLARETGAPARATMSVFMERNVGLCALLIVAIGAAELAPPVELFGLSLRMLTWLLAVAYAAANAVMMSALLYRVVDRLIAATPLAHLRHRADSLYQAIVPYKSAPGRLIAGVGLSFLFQAIVIAVVFLNARALALDVPAAAVAVFVPLVSLAGMIPVSVNGLGVREALYILLFGRIGVPVETAVSLALLYLAVTFLASLPGGVAYLMQPARARELTSDRTVSDS
jgi:glycosyltransferase 2 family protein